MATMNAILEDFVCLTFSINEVAKDALKLWDKNPPLDKEDFGRALSFKNQLAKKQSSIENIPRKTSDAMTVIEVIKDIIERLEFLIAQTKIMNPQITTIRSIGNALKK